MKLPVDRLQANDWNPNEMTAEEFAELVEEVRHLGRVPKPLVVRPSGEGFVIIDGEHAWLAAREVGLTEVTCEVAEVDDFEAMRQTYKRNQHGTMSPVKTGLMFQRMIDEQGLSGRGLAKQIGVSESTVRAALLYAKAAELRDRHAIEALGVREVRAYCSLPPETRDLWLDSGADLALVEAAGDPGHFERILRARTLLSQALESRLKIGDLVSEAEQQGFQLTDFAAAIGMQPEVLEACRDAARRWPMDRRLSMKHAEKMRVLDEIEQVEFGAA